MTFTTAFLAVGSVLGLLGFAILVVATVVTSVADLTGHDLLDPSGRTPAERRATS